MSELALKGLPINEHIVGIVEDSDEWMTRMKVQFTNGWHASIIRGRSSYGGKQGLFEMAVLDADLEIRSDMGVMKGADGIEGWLTFEQVVAKMELIAALPPEGAIDDDERPELAH